MNRKVLRQIALDSTLLPEELRDKILTGVTPSFSEMALNLTNLALDCELATASDPKASWTERRSAKIGAAAVFLLALAVED